MPGSYSPPSPLGESLLGRPLCGGLITDMEDTWTEDISQWDDTLSGMTHSAPLTCTLSTTALALGRRIPLLWVCMCLFLCGHVRPFYHGHTNMQIHTHIPYTSSGQTDS